MTLQNCVNKEKIYTDIWMKCFVSYFYLTNSIIFCLKWIYNLPTNERSILYWGFIFLHLWLRARNLYALLVVEIVNYSRYTYPFYRINYDGQTCLKPQISFRLPKYVLAFSCTYTYIVDCVFHFDTFMGQKSEALFLFLKYIKSGLKLKSKRHD